MGLTAEVTSSRDLDSMEVVLAESQIDGGVRGGFQGLWADQVRNMPTRFTLINGEIHFVAVPAGVTCTVVAVSHLQSIPKSAKLSFRVICRSGEGDWIVPATTGEIPVFFSTSD